MRRAVIPLTVVAVLALSTALAWQLGRDAPPDSASPGEEDPESLYEPGGPLPPEAVTIGQELVAGDEQSQRAALTSELAELLPEGERVFAEGAKLRLREGSWREEHGYANAFAELEVPSEPTRQVFLGFAPRDDAWRVAAVEVYQ